MFVLEDVLEFSTEEETASEVDVPAADVVDDDSALDCVCVLDADDGLVELASVEWVLEAAAEEVTEDDSRAEVSVEDTLDETEALLDDAASDEVDEVELTSVLEVSVAEVCSAVLLVVDSSVEEEEEREEEEEAADGDSVVDIMDEEVLDSGILTVEEDSAEEMIVEELSTVELEVEELEGSPVVDELVTSVDVDEISELECEDDELCAAGAEVDTAVVEDDASSLLVVECVLDEAAELELELPAISVEECVVEEELEASEVVVDVCEVTEDDAAAVLLDDCWVVEEEALCAEEDTELVSAVEVDEGEVNIDVVVEEVEETSVVVAVVDVEELVTQSD
jgi:hypothetical protein